MSPLDALWLPWAKIHGRTLGVGGISCVAASLGQGCGPSTEAFWE
jgi:hypothetical protein